MTFKFLQLNHCSLFFPCEMPPEQDCLQTLIKHRIDPLSRGPTRRPPHSASRYQNPHLAATSTSLFSGPRKKRLALARLQVETSASLCIVLIGSCCHEITTHGREGSIDGMAETRSPEDGGGWAFRDCVGEITDASSAARQSSALLMFLKPLPTSSCAKVRCACVYENA